MVCDAGGGTVDTTMYEVIGTSPLQLKECSISSSKLSSHSPSCSQNEALSSSIRWRRTCNVGGKETPEG